MTNKELKKRFQQFNKRFFENSIPNDLIVRFGKLKQDGLYRFVGEIIVEESLKKHSILVSIVLLHEMAHAHLYSIGYIGHEDDGGHQILFFTEINRLYKVGAYEGLL